MVILYGDWLVGCFSFCNSPLRQYFSLHWAFLRGRQKAIGYDRRKKNIQTSFTHAYYNCPDPSIIQVISMTPLHWKYPAPPPDHTTPLLPLRINLPLRREAKKIGNVYPYTINFIEWKMQCWGCPINRIWYEPYLSVCVTPECSKHLSHLCSCMFWQIYFNSSKITTNPIVCSFRSVHINTCDIKWVTT